MEGERYKREGIYVYTQLIHFVVQQKLTQHCKATIPQLKQKYFEIFLNNWVDFEGKAAEFLATKKRGVLTHNSTRKSK